MACMQFVLPGLPPSLNAAYPGTKHRFSSQDVQRYKNEMGIHLVKHYASTLLVCKDWEDVELEVRYVFQFTNKTSYKRSDLSNRIKVIEDLLVKITGIDDSKVLNILAFKRMGPVDQVGIFMTTELGNHELFLPVQQNGTTGPLPL